MHGQKNQAVHAGVAGVKRMKTNVQVSSIDLAKRLKDLGVKQDSIFDWVLNNYEPDYYLWLMSPYNREHLKFKEQYSAFSVSELGEMLPDCSFSWRVDNAGNIEWLCSCDEPIASNAIRANTEADARAKMLIYLIEEGLIKCN